MDPSQRPLFYIPTQKQVQAIPPIKGSRFIGVLAPAHSDEQAFAAVQECRREHYNARHHCFAWRIGTDLIRERVSDDGEPSGTAGLPILKAMQGHYMAQAVLIVIRYYGGVKLGTGGLSRAYAAAAQAVLEAASKKPFWKTLTIGLLYDYHFSKKIDHLLEKFYVAQKHSHYGEKIRVQLDLLEEEWPSFQRQFTDLTFGKAKIWISDRPSKP